MEGNNFNQAITMDDTATNYGITVSPFDYSIENHFTAMNTIRNLSTPQSSSSEAINEAELQQISSKITFLREWKDFSYLTRRIRFSCDVEDQQGKHVFGEVDLPQFSSASVPKMEASSTFAKTSDDLVLNVGGHVWALDWCPTIRQWPDCHVKCEYLAVSAHPPGSSYHKIGAPLTGRGVVQIWCLVHAVKEEDSTSISKVQRKNTKQAVEKKDTLLSKKPRGRPRKELVDDVQPPLKKARGSPKMQKNVQRSLVNLETEKESFPPLAIATSLVSSPCLDLVETTVDMDEQDPVKDSDIDLGLGGSSRENQIDQASYGQLDNGEDKKLLTCENVRGKPKKPRGRPKKKTNKESFLPLDIATSLVSSPCLGLVETTISMEEQALGKDSDIDLGLGGSNRENQIDQATYGQFDNGKEKMLLTCEKAGGTPKKPRGRCKKKTENESVPLLAIATSFKSSPCLGLVENTMSLDEQAPVEGSDIDLGGSSRENQIDQATYGQFDNGEDKKLPTCEKAGGGKPKRPRGRPKKKTENESVPLPAIATSFVSSPCLGLVETAMSMDERALVKGSDIDLGLGGSNMENQIDQAAYGQFDNGKDKKLLTCEKAGGKQKKPRRRSKKKTENESVLLLAIATPLVSSPCLDLVEATMNTLNSYNEHVKSYDSNIESQVGQTTPAEVFNTRERQPLPPKKIRWGAKKKKDTNESWVDLSTEEYFPPPPVTDPLRYEEDDVPLESKSTRGQRIRKKKDMKDFVVYSENVSKFVPALSMEGSQVSSDIPTPTEVTQTREACAPPQNSDTDFGFEAQPLNNYLRRKRKKMKDKQKTPLVMDHYKDRDSSAVLKNNNDSLQDVITPIQAKNGSLEVSTGRCDPPSEVPLPRVFICLAHNGKVAWDVKWRPPSMPDAVQKNCLGYLAVVLGNGFLEVWEVPSPTTIEVLYSSCNKESTDPRFLKLEPVFRCSKLMSGDRHSIPLTVEWSTSSPHDLLLAGCHDGTVALWKFSSSGFSQDTRPLLCFSADTHPIRALAWAPGGSDEESANIVVTAGHGGARFWDIRDPYRPLGELTQVRRFIYSLDWLQDPRCIILSFDDGTLRCWSLSKAACDVPVTGKPFVGTQQQGQHTYFCSSSPIWSVQTSRITGQVVYCGADGSALHFQLTAKAVDKDSSRYRAPHFLCGSLIEEDAALTVYTPLPNIPFPLKKSQNELGEIRSVNALLSDLNQAKRENDETPGDGTLALCYNNDTSLENDYGDRFPASKAKAASKTSKKKNPVPDLVTVDNLEKEENQGVRTEIQCLPPKIVAMHRVRWNMSKGSERWVCYGGAAGIVRCQEISS